MVFVYIYLIILAKHVINFIEKMGLQIQQDNNITPNNYSNMQGHSSKGNQKKNKSSLNKNIQNNDQISINNMGSSMNFNEDFGQMNSQSGNNLNNIYFLNDNNFGFDGMN